MGHPPGLLIQQGQANLLVPTSALSRQQETALSLPGSTQTLFGRYFGEGVLVPLSVSHTFTVWSKLPLTMRLPSALMATLRTGPVCPLRENTSVRLSASHTFTVLSSPALTMRLPSGLMATLLTEPVCPLRESVSLPLSASHTFTVLSL